MSGRGRTGWEGLLMSPSPGADAPPSPAWRARGQTGWDGGGLLVLPSPVSLRLPPGLRDLRACGPSGPAYAPPAPAWRARGRTGWEGLLMLPSPGADAPPGLRDLRACGPFGPPAWRARGRTGADFWCRPHPSAFGCHPAYAPSALPRGGRGDEPVIPDTDEPVTPDTPEPLARPFSPIRPGWPGECGGRKTKRAPDITDTTVPLIHPRHGPAERASERGRTGALCALSGAGGTFPPATRLTGCGPMG